MRNRFYVIGPLLLSLAGAFLFASFPILLQAKEGQLSLQWEEAYLQIQHYFSGLSDGSSFRFYTGRTEHSLAEQLGSYWWPSFFYVSIAALGSLSLGLLLALSLYKYRKVRNTLDMLVIIPDFVIMIMLQLFVVLFYKSTGILLARIATFMSDEPAVALPLLSMVLVPTFYVLRNLSVHIDDALTADYIRTVKAKGFSRGYILLKHMLPNVIPYLKADLPKFLGIIMSNLFIVEYFYNVHGITKLMLSSGFERVEVSSGVLSGYQFPLVLNALLVFMILYGIVLWMSRLFLYALEKGAKR
ncbi:ABC transporter permease subunit [Paenibacillus swuensis]|nr:ABC transporter permease subunit [Paenibacillus swuensis]